MTTPPRVLFIGLDSAEPTLLRQWMDSGQLPVLARLRERSLEAGIADIPGFGNGSQWPTLATGSTPGRHGRYNRSQIVPGTYRTGVFSDDDIDWPVFWEALSAAGRRVAVVDAIHLPMCPEINGLQIRDWAPHGPMLPDFKTVPSALADEIRQRFGTGHLPGDGEVPDRTPANEQRMAELMLERIGRKTDLLLDMLRREPWDLFYCCYHDLHDIGHQFWHYHDPTHPAHDPARVAALGDLLLEGYRRVDQGLGRLLEAAGPDVCTFVVSLTGMEGNYSGNQFLADVLLRIDRSEGEAPGGATHLLRRAYRALLPQAARDRIRKRAPGVTALASDRVHSDEKCFILTHPGNAGAIRINLRGREPHGTVAPGAEYEATCARLEETLGELVDPDNGEPLVDAVIRVDDHCPGPARDRLPDILVRWRRHGRPITAAASPRIGVIRNDRVGPRTGDHSFRNLALVSGPGIAPGRRDEPFRIVDIAPTIAAFLGVDLPGIDGRPLPLISAGPAAAARAP